MKDQDKKIVELVAEVKEVRKTKPNLSHAEIKTVLKGRGTDDELDLAIVMEEVKPVNWWWVGVKYLLVTVVILLIMLVVNFTLHIVPDQFFFMVPAGAIILFFSMNAGYRQEYLEKLINHDFGFVEMTGHEAKQYLDMILGVPKDAKARMIKKCQFDGRESYYGFFEWERGSGKSKQTFYRTYVLQVMDKNFDPILIQPHSVVGLDLFGEDVELESNEFNQQFVVKTGGEPKNAFYTLNPRVMELILKEYDDYNFNFLQVHDNVVVLGYDERMGGIRLGSKFNLPVIEFDEFLIIKKKILQKFDVLSNISDGLLREIIDEEGIRSQAEN